MIGEFGEVYVVDWGIAVSLIDDGTNRLALARDVTEVVGTLGYMSTEMLRLNVPLTERTDVYLLGAILHEILSGRSPHAGSDIHEVIASIIASKPALPKDAPTELAEICRRAMAVAPEDRFETVDAMQHAISEFINHRGSTRLSGHALDRLTELESELAGAHEADEDKRQRIYHLFGECRFGFREAIIAWPGNEDAKSGRRRALCGMAEYELSHGDPRAARTLVREIDEPPAELANRIDEALDALDRDKERIEQLEKLGKDLDPMIGRRTRLAIGPGFAMTSLVATAVPLFFDQNFYVDSHGHIVTAVGGLVVLFTAAGVWARDSMMKTRLNRGVYSSLLMCLIAELILEVALMFKDIPAANTLFVHPLMWAVTAGFASIAFDRRLVPTAMAFLAACLLTVASPVHGHFGVMAASVLFIVNAFVIWGRPKDEPPKEANVS